ncbi:MAG TPA: translocation/assembly module TamB domain-containing protein [Kofleriaceae bacterium]|nr:translocation/assembly module TamB domain-containing protein [Kofleriaceae bacterium]
MRTQRRWRRWSLVIGSAVLILVGVAFAVLRTQLEGPGLADKIASALNKRMRGRIEVGAVEWPTAALETVATGGWVPVRIHDVKLWDDCVLSADIPKDDPDAPRGGDPNQDCTPDDRPDPDPTSKRKPRKLLITVPLITAEIDIHALMFGHHDFVFRRLYVHGGEALLEQTREPYPLHAYDRTIVSIVTAFYPRMKAGFRAGIYADKPPPIFDLHDIHLEHLGVTLHLGPYGNKDGTIGYAVTARLEDVNADADASATDDKQNYLHMDATDALIAKFYVRLQLAAAHGRIRIQDEGPRNAFHIPATDEAWGAHRKARYDVQLSQIELHKLAQMPKPGSKFATTLAIDLSAHTLPCDGSGAQAGAELHVAGGLEEYWARPYDGRWNLALDIANLGPTLHTCIKSKLGGDNLGGHVTLTGPFIAPPKVAVDLHGLDVDIPLSRKTEPLRLTLAEVHGDIDLVNDVGQIEQTKAQIRGGQEPGELTLGASFALKPYNARAQLDITKPIDVGRFLPAQVATGVGRYLSGKLTATGDVDTGFALENFDLSLGPSLTDKLVRVHRGRIFTSNNFDTIGIQKVAIEAGKSHAVFDGTVDTVKQTLNVRIEEEFGDLDVWLKRFGIPAFATSAGGGSIVISGPLKSPTVGVRLNLGGVPCMDTLTLDADVRDQVATINHIGSTGLGGQLDGKGVVSLGGGVKVIQSFHIEGKKLDASRLCGLAGIVKGTLDAVDVDLKTTPVVPGRPALDWLAYVQAFVKADRVNIAGDGYSNLALCINRPDDNACRDANQAARLGPTDPAMCADAKIRTGGACVVARAERDKGGKLAATIIDVPAVKTAKLQVARHLAGTLAIDDVPLAVLDQFVGANTIGGLFSATLHLQGSGDAPQASGSLTLIRSWVKNAFVGDSELQVSPIMVGKVPSVFLHGSALAGQVQISATIGTAAPYPLELAISGRRVEVDNFVAVDKLIGVADPIQAWASGTVTVKTELAPLHGKKAVPEAWLELTELEAILDHHSRDGRLTPLRFSLAPAANDGFALSMRLTPQAVELACRDLAAPNGRRPCSTQLVTPAGVVELEGGASTSQMNVKATGQLMLAKLLPLFETQLDSISGTLDLDATLAGTFAKPSYQGELLVHDRVEVKPTGGDTTLQVLPGGQLRLADGTLGFNSLTISVKDERAQEAGQLHVKGNIVLDGWQPSAWGVLIDGTIAGKMLLALAPNAVAQASGLARIDGALELFGKGALPQISGTVTFDPPNDKVEQKQAALSISPRGARHEVALLGGSIDIATKLTGDHRTYTLAIDDDPLTASIDGDGKLTDIRGRVVLDNGTPTEAQLELDAENVPFRIPGSINLVVSARDVELALLPGRTAWSARGSISLISGEYSRNFELTDAIKPVASNTPPAKPLWDEYPSIGNADLDLTLDVRRFQVKNNIARNGIDLEGPHIRISGTPRDPRLSGSIRVQRGEFQIPGTRATFTRTLGSIDFAENDKATNPHLDITSDSDYTDLSGQLHIITLTIGGTLEAPNWDLKTSTGYNKSQTLTLLFLGRNPEQLRRSLGDQSLGADPTRIDPTTNPSTGFADQIVKDLAGDWVSGLIGDKLTKITRLDVLRFEIGFGDVGIYAVKNVAENIKVIGDFEQTIRGQTINVTGEFKTPWHLPWHLLTNDQLTVQGVYLYKNYYDPAEEDIKDYRGQLVYRLFIPPLFP